MYIFKQVGDIVSLYLNQDNSGFFDSLNSKIFIDKSNLLTITNSNIRTDNKFMCVTRPRRFGKTMALSMLNAYYSKGCDSKELFKDLKISKDENYLIHLNKHNVIWIDMARIYLKYKENFIKGLNRAIIEDFNDVWPNVLKDDDCTIDDAILRIYNIKHERFIFLIDEWDVIYREQENNAKLCDEYTEFLRILFKSSEVSNCIDLVYMTGILPIKRYSTQSTLNMFDEYNMLDADCLTPYFGFTEDEVINLCNKYNRNFDEIKTWYNGYKLNNISLYNPKSVVEAIRKNKCSDYWTQTSAIEAVTDYMNYDNGELKDIICQMLVGNKVDVNVSRFSNDLTKVNSIDAALTVLIHLGYLAYDNNEKKCYIPNYEIRLEFLNALQELNWSDLYNPISNSKKLYEETLKGNIDFINQTFDQNHKELAGPFNKNKEDILGVITLISYYSTKQFYDIHKEVNTTLGRADMVFIPKDNNHIPMIIELKVDSSPDEAINQIKDKEYVNTLGTYKGDVLLLGISYDSSNLKHSSKIERVKI